SDPDLRLPAACDIDAVHRARQLHVEDAFELVRRRAHAMDAVERLFVEQDASAREQAVHGRGRGYDPHVGVRRDADCGDRDGGDVVRDGDYLDRRFLPLLEAGPRPRAHRAERGGLKRACASARRKHQCAPWKAERAKMAKAYWVARVDVRDPEGYKAYVAA